MRPNTAGHQAENTMKCLLAFFHLQDLSLVQGRMPRQTDVRVQYVWVDICPGWPYERKRHSSENRPFSAPLVRCSIAPMLLILCRVAQFVPCCSFVPC